jgi:hypothetical protein
LWPFPLANTSKRFGDGKGAYVNVVAWAESAQHFEVRVATTAGEQLECIVREMERVGSLEASLEGEGCPDELFTMQATAERQPNDVVFGTFHVWHQEDAN